MRRIVMTSIAMVGKTLIGFIGGHRESGLR